MAVTKSTIGALALAAVLVLAGCSGAPGGAPSPAAETTQTGIAPTSGQTVEDGGTVEFYLSDERNAIGDFESLTVTITKVGLHQTGGVESDRPQANTTNAETSADAANATVTATEADVTNTTETPGDETDGTDNVTAARESKRDESREQENDERRERDDEGESAWVEYEVNATADLTELQGANATQLDVLDAPHGSYDTVFVYVDAIEATLTTGETVTVKLPSSKLHVNRAFTLGEGENVSFVFDIAVHEAGQSGKYILKPVVSQSGTSKQVEIADVTDRREQMDTDDDEGERGPPADDERGPPENAEDRGSPGDEADSSEDLSVEALTPIEIGSNATLRVSTADEPVENATVMRDDQQLGVTNASGLVTVAVPESIEEIELTVMSGDAEVELEREFDN